MSDATGSKVDLAKPRSVWLLTGGATALPLLVLGIELATRVGWFLASSM